MSLANFAPNFGPLKRVPWKNYASCFKALVLEIPKHPIFLKIGQFFMFELVKFGKKR